MNILTVTVVKIILEFWNGILVEIMVNIGEKWSNGMYSQKTATNAWKLLFDIAAGRWDGPASKYSGFLRCTRSRLQWIARFLLIKLIKI